MQLVKDGRSIIRGFIEWILYVLGYTVVFIVLTSFFHSIYIDTNHNYIYSFLIVFIVSILNKTIKSILMTFNNTNNRFNFRLILSFYKFIYIKNSRLDVR